MHTYIHTDISSFSTTSQCCVCVYVCVCVCVCMCVFHACLHISVCVSGNVNMRMCAEQDVIEKCTTIMK